MWNYYQVLMGVDRSWVKEEEEVCHLDKKIEN
jgi:hypothetical protein